MNRPRAVPRPRGSARSSTVTPPTRADRGDGVLVGSRPPLRHRRAVKDQYNNRKTDEHKQLPYYCARPAASPRLPAESVRRRTSDSAIQSASEALVGAGSCFDDRKASRAFLRDCSYTIWDDGI